MCRALAGLVFVASSAYAAPWKTSVPLADSGPAAQAELDGKGVLVIQLPGGTERVQIAPAITRATLQTARVMGVPTIVIEATTPAGDEAIVVQPTTRGWAPVVRVPVGGVGVDGEYAVAVTATPAGIYRYQTRNGYHRCDGKPAYLFAEGFDGQKFRRLSKLPIDLPDGATTVSARADSQPASHPVVYQARVASHEASASDAGALAIPSELDDGRPDTTWNEGLAASSGEGQFFTFEPRVADVKATQLRVIGGGKGFNRPKRLGVVWAGGAVHVDVPDDSTGGAYIADLPSPVSGCVTVVLETTWGAVNGTTALGELEVFAEGERAGGGDAMLAAVIAAGGDGERAAAQELARHGASGAAAIDSELARTTQDAARRRLVRALAGMRDPTAGPVLARAIAQHAVDGQDLIDAITALGVVGGSAQLRELAGQEGLPADARVAAVRGLARTNSELAIEIAGSGPRAVRRAVIDTLTHVRVAVLVPAARGAASASAAGDLWRAITRRAHATPGERAEALAAMTAALPAASDYERRYRLIEGVATLGDADALRSLAALLASLPADASAAAFGQVAAQAIADQPRPEAVAVVLELARAKDAGVRFAAFGALASAPDDAGGDRVLATALASDSWPELRRRAAQVLGGRCSRADPARALTDAFGRDPEVSVRGDALAALVDCKAAGTTALLARTWGNGKLPLELRQRAVDLAPTLGDRAVGEPLLEALSHWRRAAFDDPESLALAQNAAYAIGRLAPPGAAAALESTMADGSFPELVAAAATGLGLMGRACPASAKTKLSDLARSDDEQIKLAAGRAAAICGK